MKRMIFCPAFLVVIFLFLFSTPASATHLDDTPTPAHSPTPHDSPTPDDSPTPHESPTSDDSPTPHESPSPTPTPRASPPEPLIFLNFNENGSIVPNRGKLDITFRMFDRNNDQADLHSDDGFGVSNQPGDRAFDNERASEKMGGEGGRVESRPHPDTDRLLRFTLMAWYKLRPDDFDGNGAVLMHDGNGIGAGYSLDFFYKEFLLLVNSGEAKSRRFGFEDPDEWNLVSVTYDGNKGQDNVQFFKGSEISPVQLVITETIQNGGETLPNDEGFTVGNHFEEINSAFDALIDNVRLFKEILTLEELEELRRRDLARQTPTPTASPTETPTPSPEESPTPTESPSPNHSPTPEESPTPTRSPTPEESPTPTRSPTPEESPTPSPSPTPEEECSEVTSLALSISSVEMEVDETLEVVVSVKCQHGEKLSSQPIFAKKKGSKESKKRIHLDKEVGVTNSDGKATFKILALKKGKAKVRFRSEEKDLKAVLKIRIRS